MSVNDVRDTDSVCENLQIHDVYESEFLLLIYVRKTFSSYLITYFSSARKKVELFFIKSFIKYSL